MLFFVYVKILIFGTETDFIADYMPGSLPSTPYPFNTFPFVSLARKVALLRLSGFIIFNIVFCILYSKILFKVKIYKAKKDLIYTYIIFIIPLIICYILIYNQLHYTI